MKNIQRHLPYLILLLGLAVLIACNKDDSSGVDNIVGSWNIDNGSVVASVSGAEVYNGDLTATGSFTFNEDSTGTVNMQLAFDASTSSLNGSFNWLKSSNDIILNQGTADETRFTRTKNDKNLQELEFRQEVSSDDAVIDYVIVLRRK